MPKPGSVETHEGREIELIAAGTKPLAVMSIPLTAADDGHDDWLARVRPMIEAGQLLVERSTEIWRDGPCDTVAGRLVGLRQVILCRSDQAWRVPAWRMLEASGDRLGWDEAHERMSSFLLGYDPEAIDRHIAGYRRRRSAWTSITVCWAIGRHLLPELEALAGRAMPNGADLSLPLVLEPDTRLDEAARRLLQRCGDVMPIRFALETRFAMSLERRPALARFTTRGLGARTVADLNVSLRSCVEIVRTESVPSGRGRSTGRGKSR